MPKAWLDKAPYAIILLWIFLPYLMLSAFFLFPLDVDTIRFIYGILIQITGNLTVFLTIIVVLNHLASGKSSYKKLFQAPWFLLLLLMLLWSFVSALCAKDFHTAFFGNWYFQEGFFAYFYYGAACYISCNLNEKYKHRVLTAFIFSSSGLSIVFLLKYMGIPFVDDYIFIQEFAFFNSSNVFGYYLTMSISLTAAYSILRNKNSLIITLFLALQIYTLIMNNTFGSFLAVTVIMILIPLFVFMNSGYVKLNYFIPLLTFIITCALHYLVSSIADKQNTLLLNFGQLSTDLSKISSAAVDAGTAGSGRMAIWKRTIQILFYRPLLGYGSDLTYEAYKIAGINHTRPHNEIMQHALFLGIPAALMYIISLTWLFIRQIKTIKYLSNNTLIAAFAVIGYVVSSLFGCTTPWSTTYFFIFLALSADQRHKSLEDKL